MTNSSSSSNSLSRRIKALVVVVLALAVLGFVDSSYLAVSHYFSIPLPCSIVNGCEKVTTSAYSTVFGIPLALFGAAYYLVIIVLAIAVLDAKKERLIRSILLVSGIGFLVSLVLVYLQIFVLGALCMYCLISAIDSTLIFFLSYQGKNNERNETQEH